MASPEAHACSRAHRGPAPRPGRRGHARSREPALHPGGGGHASASTAGSRTDAAAPCSRGRGLLPWSGSPTTRGVEGIPHAARGSGERRRDRRPLSGVDLGHERRGRGREDADGSQPRDRTQQRRSERDVARRRSPAAHDRHDLQHCGPPRRRRTPSKQPERTANRCSRRAAARAPPAVARKRGANARAAPVRHPARQTVARPAGPGKRRSGRR